MDAEQAELVISRVAHRTTVLGPGVRAVVWVHGCPLRCAGCVAPEDLPFEGGVRRTVADLAAELNALSADVRGLTLSGGEPMAQAGPLAALVRALRRDRDWSVMSYTGFTLEHLRRHGTDGQRALLAELDLLVDGPYVAARHADLLWRGSANQRLRFLTGRHAPPAEDRSAGLEFHVADDTLAWVGVPPVPGFRETFEDAMAGARTPLAVAVPTPNGEDGHGVG
ncbi:4Fe-4S single cluster domain-containing protein [Catenulispora subtropica]|uniref:Uncharacterized protein n=1 Tax=Catenulispora subtropica TaxID=450798 RepID=A0ABP5EEQ3_9ACTN